MIDTKPLPWFHGNPVNKPEKEEIQTLAQELVPPSDKILRANLEPFNFQNPPEDPVKIAIKIADTMIKNNGIGLAANQIGLPYRVFAMKTNPVIVCFNPRIVDRSTTQSTLDEGCLTFPGLMVKVKRADMIKVRYAEPNGQMKTTKFAGLTAHIFQHELDHLNGIFMTDHVGRAALELAIKKAKKLGHKYSMGDFQ